MTDYFKVLFSALYILFSCGWIWDTSWDSRPHAQQFNLLFIVVWTICIIAFTVKMKNRWMVFALLPITFLAVELGFYQLLLRI